MEGSGWAPLVLIELVLIFGGVLAFAVWQLRSVERDMQRTREARAREANRDPAPSAAPPPTGPDEVQRHEPPGERR